MMRRALHVAGVLAAFGVSTTIVRAQDPRIPGKIDAQSRIVLTAIIDSAKAQGLPLPPLLDKVDEGQSKGADGPRIVSAVRALAQEMSDAHRALGSVASTDEIKAAASAMHAGVPAVELGKIKKQSGLRRLTLPFTVLSDMVSRGVPVNTALSAVRSLMSAGAKDADLSDFQRNVKDDIQQGASPGAAAETRARQAEKSGDKKPEQDKFEL